jgi:hypothetical protein
MMKWEVKLDMWLSWEKEKDQIQDDEMRSEMGSAIDMKGNEGSPKRWWIDKIYSEYKNDQ